MTSIVVDNAAISKVFYWLWDNLEDDEFAYLPGALSRPQVWFHFKDDAHAVMFKLRFSDAPHFAR